MAMHRVFCLLALAVCLSSCSENKHLSGNSIYEFSFEQGSAGKYEQVALAQLFPDSKFFSKVYVDAYDLNNDGIKEIAVFDYPHSCIEHFCQLYLLQRNNNRWRIILKTMSFFEGVHVLQGKKNSFHDIQIQGVKDVEIFRPHTMLYQWDGQKYQTMETIYKVE
jgi:hypothetical protein